MLLREIDASLTRVLAVAILGMAIGGIAPVVAGDVFSYQARFTDGGVAADGLYDFRFRLYSTLAGPEQVGPELTIDGVNVVQGQVTVDLDFGDVFDWTDYWLEVDVKSGTLEGGYTMLVPRQPIQPTPYALFAWKTGMLADGGLPADYTQAAVFSNPANQFVGDGFGITNISASNVAAGNLDSARLPTGGGWALGSSLDIDANTFFLDPTADRIGIGTSTPTTALDVAGTVRMLGFEMPTGASPGQVLTSDASGVGTWQPALTIPLSVVIFETDPGLSITNGGSGTPLVGVTLSDGGTGVRGVAGGISGTGVIGEGFPGVHGITSGSAGEAVLGTATHGSAAVTGIRGTTPSTSGVGVHGEATATTGSTIGTRGRTSSTMGTGVKGEAPSTTGTAIGVHGVSAGTAGTGVKGEATNANGPNIGIHGIAAGATGIGAQGEATDATGFNIGVRGVTPSPFGTGVQGEATAANSSFAVGVVGLSSSTSGTGVRGTALATSGSTTGVSGTNASPDGCGVFGFAFANTGLTTGVKGQASSIAGTGVHGLVTATGGPTVGVLGEAASSEAVAVYGRATRSSGMSTGVIGESASNTGTGVYGLVSSINGAGERIGVKGEFTDGRGIAVQGIAPVNTNPTRAVQGINGSNAGQGGTDPTEFAVAVEGLATATDGVTRGVRGVTESKNGIGVEGVASFDGDAADVPPSVGVFGRTFHARGTAVKAINGSSVSMETARGLYAEVPGPGTAIEARVNAGTDGIAIEAHGAQYGLVAGAIDAGVLATSPNTGVKGVATGNFGAGVEGEATGTASFGVIGSADSVSNGTGVYGEGSGVGVVGFGPIGVLSEGDLEVNGSAMITGNVVVGGTVSKGGGSFRIDHPLDPENKYLYHSFVESPDMMNIYNGIVVTDIDGRATITMPDWFEALNRDFRYQLTVIDDSEDFVFAKVTREIVGNQFTIRTSRPRTKVSWQVTGVRQDDWANENRIQVEVDKPKP